MCMENIEYDLDNLAGCLWVIHRELDIDQDKVRHLFDRMVDDLETAHKGTPEAHVAVRNSVGEAHSLAQEAFAVLYDNRSGWADNKVMAQGLLTVARLRLQQAIRCIGRVRAWEAG